MNTVYKVACASAAVLGLAACEPGGPTNVDADGGSHAEGGRAAGASAAGTGAAIGGGPAAGAAGTVYGGPIADAGSAADGGDTDAAPAPASGPIGYLFGPIGTRIDVGLAGESVAASIAAEDVPAESLPAAYFLSRFQFPSALDAGAMYNVTLGTPQANQSCRVFMGQSGTASMLTAQGAIRIGCEWNYDYVSLSSDGAAHGSGSTPAIGGANATIGSTEAMGEGRFVVFRSSVQGLAGNSNDAQQIFWRDRLDGITRLVSHAPDGTQGDDRSERPAISADGLTVVFRSYAKNLVPGDTNNRADIFVWSALDDSVARVSVGPSGEQADAESDTPTVSGDGKVVAFVTNSTTVAPVANDGTSTRKVVRIDRASGAHTVVSRGWKSGYPADGSWPMLSEDGMRLVFESFRDMPGDINTYAWDIFVYDHTTGETWPVTLSSDGAAHGGEGTCVSCGTTPAISGDGKWVTFADGSTNLVPNVSDGLLHYWLVEVDACKPAPGTCHIVPIDVAADDSPADAASSTKPAPLSYDGRYVSFVSVATNLGAPKGAYQQSNVFIFDRDSTSRAARVKPVTMITENVWGTEEYTGISREGAYVVFKVGAQLDPRVDDSGVFAAFTGVADALVWYRGPLE